MTPDLLPPRMARKVVVDDNGCWIWTGSRNEKGYGRVWVDRRPGWSHRLAYELLVGAIPAGLQIDHLCVVPACCNPQHLEPVTAMENVRRAFERRGRLKHCIRGHELTDDNIYVRPSYPVRRECRTCRRLSWAAA